MDMGCAHVASAVHLTTPPPVSSLAHLEVVAQQEGAVAPRRVAVAQQQHGDDGVGLAHRVDDRLAARAGPLA
eukprot:scaffold117150_cov69-Phaeocystis_antarctica.AAC.1